MRLLAVALCVLAGLIGAQAATADARPADYRVACLTAGGNDVGRVRPGVCTILGLGFGDGGYYSLRSLLWSGWGSAIATARGVHKFRPLEPSAGGARSLPITMRFRSLRRGCDERLWYGVVEVVESRVAFRMPLPTCGGPRA